MTVWFIRLLKDNRPKWLIRDLNFINNILKTKFHNCSTKSLWWNVFLSQLTHYCRCNSWDKFIFKYIYKLPVHIILFLTLGLYFEGSCLLGSTFGKLYNIPTWVIFNVSNCNLEKWRKKIYMLYYQTSKPISPTTGFEL